MRLAESLLRLASPINKNIFAMLRSFGVSQKSQKRSTACAKPDIGSNPKRDFFVNIGN